MEAYQLTDTLILAVLVPTTIFLIWVVAKCEDMKKQKEEQKYWNEWGEEVEKIVNSGRKNRQYRA